MFIFGTSVKKVSLPKPNASHHAKSAGHHASHKNTHTANRQAFRQNSLNSLSAHGKKASAIKRHAPLAKSEHPKTKTKSHVATKSAKSKELAKKRRIEEHKAEHKVNVKVSKELHKLSKSKKDLAKHKAKLAILKKQKAFDDRMNASSFTKFSAQKIKATEKKIAKDKKDIKSYGKNLGKDGHKKLVSIHHHTSEIQKYKDRLKGDKKAYKRMKSAEEDAKRKFDVEPGKREKIAKKRLLADIKKSRSLIVKHKHALTHLKKSLIKPKSHTKKDPKAKSAKKLKNKVTKKSPAKSKIIKKAKASAKPQHASKNVVHSNTNNAIKASSGKASSSKKPASKKAKSTNFASSSSVTSKRVRHDANRKHISNVKTHRVSSPAVGSSSKSYTPSAASSKKATITAASLGNRVASDLAASTVTTKASTNFRQASQSSMPTLIPDTGHPASDTRFYQPPYYTQMQNGNMLMRQANGVLPQTAMSINNANNIQLIERILLDKINQLTQENQLLRQNMMQAQATNQAALPTSSISRNGLADSLNNSKADAGDNLLQRRAMNKPESVLSEINIASVDSRLADNNQQQAGNNSFEVGQ